MPSPKVASNPITLQPWLGRPEIGTVPADFLINPPRVGKMNTALLLDIRIGKGLHAKLRHADKTARFIHADGSAECPDIERAVDFLD
jgi:hypothetical protein